MTNEQLILKYQKGHKQVLNEIIRQNMGIVNQIANKYYSTKSNSIDKDDLVQEGYLGLMIAADKYKFDIDKPAQFITYAAHWIRQKISRYLYQRNTNEETSLNISIGENADTELQDILIDEKSQSIEESIYITELHQELEGVMNNYLSLKEREVVKLKFGWNNFEEMTDEEIGNILGLNQFKVASIRNRALRKMKRSSWGARIYREKYGIKRIKAYDNVDSLIERLDFEERYSLYTKNNSKLN